MVERSFPFCNGSRLVLTQASTRKVSLGGSIWSATSSPGEEVPLMAVKTTQGLPDFTIPTVLSFLTTRDICACACISKEWAHCAQKRRIEIKEKASRARSQMSNEEQEEMDEALLDAATEDDSDKIEALIAKGANIEARNFNEQTALFKAATMDQLSTVEVLIAAGANIEARDDEDMTPLMSASFEGCRSVVEVLIFAEANMNAIGAYGDTALILATKEDNLGVAIALIDLGADLSIRGSDGLTALQIATKYGYHEIASALRDD